MKKQSIRMLLLGFFVCSLFGLASAEDIYVKNKLFKGETVGRGMDTELSLQALGEALGMEVAEQNGEWKLGEALLPGRQQDGQTFVDVASLKKAGFRVIHSPELGTIDIAAPRQKTASAASQRPKRTANAGWGGGGGYKPTLVYFGADW